jgi:hypothetical protein
MMGRPRSSIALAHCPTSDCKHIMDDEDLQSFYRAHPDLICARCWIAGRVILQRGSGQRVAFWEE